MAVIDTVDQLRQRYAPPKGRTVKKQLTALEKHSKHFISLSPLVTLATYGESGADASPRGGAPGFVRVLDDTTLLIPDSPGNNRLDSLQNIVETSRLGLLFLIPGVNETLRINGRAQLCDDAELCQLWQDEKRTPKLVIKVLIDDVYLHCAKALMRSELWSAQAQIQRSELPTMGVMIRDQLGETGDTESQQDMEARYQQNLY